MKKVFISLYIALIINVGFTLNVDYGASIDSFTGYNSSDETYFFGFEKISLYSSVEITKSINLAVDGFYKFSYKSSESDENKHILDFKTLLMTFPVANYGLQVGRNTISDYSGDILSHTLDGVTISTPVGSATLVGHIGFSGLVNVEDVTFLSTVLDDNTISRIVEGADLIKEMDLLTLWASLYSYQDFNSSENFSLYLGGGVNGTIKNDIFYSVRGNLQAGKYLYEDDTTTELVGSDLIAGMGVLSVSWFLNSDNEMISRLSPYLSVDFGMSSGDSNIVSSEYGVSQPKSISDGVNQYSPMVSGGPGVIYSINNQNLTYFKAVASVSPVKSLQTQLGSTLFFRTVKGATSTVGSDDSGNYTNGNYMGTEIFVTGNYRPFSDLGISVTGGMFFPDGTVVDSDPTGVVTVYLSLSL